MSPEKTRKKGSLLKNICVLLLLAGAAFIVHLKLQERKLVIRENAAIECSNNGKLDEAVKLYVQLYPLTKSIQKERVAKSIASCYCTMAEEASLSFKEGVELYRKAYQYDPTSVTNPKIVEIIKRSE